MSLGLHCRECEQSKLVSGLHRKTLAIKASNYLSLSRTLRL